MLTYWRAERTASEAPASLIALSAERFQAAARPTPLVQLIRAHTLPAANASTRVLAKSGLVHVGTFIDPDDGPVWRWEKRRYSPQNGPSPERGLTSA